MLPELVEALTVVDRDRFERIYQVSRATASMRIPGAMAPWAERTFGPLSEVETQTIVRVSNVVTGEGTLFNGLRAHRPVRPALRVSGDFEKELTDDAWAVPEEATPEDPFGRLANDHGTTAANVAKYDAAHSVVIFREPNPLAFTQASVTAQLDLARQWMGTAHAHDRDAKYPYLMWNCLWRAGGSIVHGHTQVSLARGRHYARIERLRRDAFVYGETHATGYFDDLVEVHRALGLSVEMGGIHGMAHLTPLKEKEVVLLGEALDGEMADAIYRTLSVFRDSLGVQSFNLGILLPPIAASEESWEGFPVVVRIVDRGALSTRTSDIGGMEMFAESVVAADPFLIRAVLAGPGA